MTGLLEDQRTLRAFGFANSFFFPDAAMTSVDFRRAAASLSSSMTGVRFST
jgi:hypothetical protein